MLHIRHQASLLLGNIKRYAVLHIQSSIRHVTVFEQATALIKYLDSTQYWL